jgi:hypothetical protein
MNSITTVKTLLWIASLILIVLVGGLVGAYFVSKAFFSGMVVIIALITFFGFLILGSSKEQHEELTEKNMRLAVAASIVITYMVIVGTTIFFGEHIGKMPDLASTALTSFTSIVGVVVAFYFGGSVYTEIQEKKLGKKDD